MSISAKMYGNFLKCALNKEIDLDSDTIKVMLCNTNYTPNQDSDIYKDQAIPTGEVSGSNYLAGGVALTNKLVTYDGPSNSIIFKADNVSWANSTINNVSGIYQ